MDPDLSRPHLTPFLNAKAFGSHPGEASLESDGHSLPAPSTIGTNGTYQSVATGIQYVFPGYTGPDNPDNILSLGQTIPVTAASYFSASLLLVSDKSDTTTTGNITLTYTDNATTVSELRVKPYFAFPIVQRGEIILPYRFPSNDIDRNATNIHEISVPLDAGKKLKTITLPETDIKTGGINVFAISLWKGAGGIRVQSVRPTQQVDDEGNQVVELLINNSGADCVSGGGLMVSVSAPGVSTVTEAKIRRLCPGDQKKARVSVSGTYTGVVKITLDYIGSALSSSFDGVEIGLSDYTTDLNSLVRHESPQWFDDAKYGIFIHWGPYAVPGWGNSTPYENYAEWFWYWSTRPNEDNTGFTDYRLRTFGPNWTYDDSFAKYTASAWDPKEWVDLFAAAGVKYFVFTTKHHDGFANFDTQPTTARNSLNYGPKRDVLKELMDAAKLYQPGLRRGTYFSMPEWFNPDYEEYGFKQWPGIIARNPFTGQEEPYTGRVEGVGDYLANIQLPQMETLAYDYETEIMWCDIGGPNLSGEFAAKWWNWARGRGRDVTINSRCGLAQVSDFDTPEYETFSSAQQYYKWESSRGMDPFSYGYNRATPPEQYMNASVIVSSLVDIVSKNGNFLLDIGPMADGSILPIEADALREAGSWIARHEEAIFNTTFWFIKSEIEGDGGGMGARFTQTEGAFYVLFLERPVVGEKGVVRVEAPVPILEGDVVSMWNVVREETNVVLEISVDDGILAKDEYCWVFKIAYAE
ncbi:putative alpha-L-fucosidase [Pseudomassariella vexata]|uniref:alpha-L-fucosidase n=1 Tax=Pseudomassariella vexata TaxID=1141098 RepID=A0A1Y2DR79_9PEZI|nr:putative alpha-L-fucosidase [Pseudomassariella vexata]ORY61737.1 putative alpha-L-fucosidase [Pseudomassariella vexata]